MTLNFGADARSISQMLSYVKQFVPIFLAVPFGEHREIAKILPSWEGKTIIDAMNSFPIPLENLDGLPSSAFVAKSFSGAKLVKAFNHLGAAKPASDPVVEGGHRVVFLLSDDEEAIAPVEDLAAQLGFAPVKLGKLNEGRWLVHSDRQRRYAKCVGAGGRRHRVDCSGAALGLGGHT